MVRTTLYGRLFLEHDPYGKSATTFPGSCSFLHGAGVIADTLVHEEGAEEEERRSASYAQRPLRLPEKRFTLVHAVRRTPRIGAAKIDGPRNLQEIVSISESIAARICPFEQHGLKRVFRRRHEFGMIEKIEAHIVY